MHNGATVVIVPKEKFLERLVQVVFVEERSFPLALIGAAEGRIAQEQLNDAACALALPLSDGASLADVDTALAILDVASRKPGSNETQKVPIRPDLHYAHATRYRV